MRPSGQVLQPGMAEDVAVTAASTSPSRMRLAVWSWSSMLMSSSSLPSRVKADMASMNQVDSESALTASLSVGRAVWPSGTSSGFLRRRSFSSRATCSTCRHRRRPASVPEQGWPRSTSTWPTRSSSSLMRWETAEGVTCSLRAARSKLPSRTTAARASSPA